MPSLRTILGSFALSVATMCTAATAQPFPAKPVTLVVPAAAGGPTDLLARILQAKLEGKLGQNVIVENRVGGATYSGGEYVSRAAPDGYTLLVQAYSGVHQHLFVKGLPVVLSHSLVPVAALTDSPYLLLVSTPTPAKNLKELIAYGKENPKKLNAGAIPAATNSVELVSFLKSNGIEFEEIPYNGTAAMLTAQMKDEVQVTISSIGSVKQQVLEGKLRALAVTAEERDPSMPDVPSAKEQGFAFSSSVFFAVFAPPGTPAAVVKTLNGKIDAAMADPETKDRIEKSGYALAKPQNQEALAARLKRETDAIEKMVKDAGIVPQ